MFLFLSLSFGPFVPILDIALRRRKEKRHNREQPWVFFQGERLFLPFLKGDWIAI